MNLCSFRFSSPPDRQSHPPFSLPTVLTARIRWLGLTGLIWLALMIPAHAELLLRIAIRANVPRILVGGSVGSRLLDKQGNVLAEVPGMAPITAARNGSVIQAGSASADRLYLQPVTPDGLVFIGKNWYRGIVELIPEGQGLTAVNQVGLEDYVSSVVGAEMGHRFPAEALKSQAIASRTYALFHRNRRIQAPYDLGDETDWQVYRGINSESNLTQAAAQTTASQVLTYQGQLIDAVFHSSSGGHTEDSGNVWTTSLPYLQGVPDFDVAAPVFSWTATASTQQLQAMAGGIGSITNAEVVQRTPFGRAMMVRLTGTSGTKDISAQNFQSAMNLRSTLFTITSRSSNATTASLVPVAGSLTFDIAGRGFGHGIGMSQWGAAGLAAQGWTYQQILAHYYRGTGLAAVESP